MSINILTYYYYLHCLFLSNINGFTACVRLTKEYVKSNKDENDKDKKNNKKDKKDDKKEPDNSSNNSKQNSMETLTFIVECGDSSVVIISSRH